MNGIRGLLIIGFWLAALLEVFHPGEHRFFLIHDGQFPIQFNFGQASNRL